MLVLSWLAGGPSIAGAEPTDKPGAKPAAASSDGRLADHVVLVSIDGLAASYLDDPRAELPTLRELRARGASAKGMITSFPSVTWPAHVSLVTGVHPARHGVVGNAVWNRRLERSVTYIGDPELTKDQAIRAPTLYDVVDAAGLSAASVIWPCCNGAKSLRWVIPDSNKPELHAKFTTPGFAAELAAAGVDISPLGAWGWDKKHSVARDEVYTSVALYLLDRHRPNLLLVHLITPDGVEHGFGPQTPEAYQAVKESDAHVRRLWEALKKPPFAGRSTLVVVSDHGFAPYDKLLRVNQVLREHGLVAADEAGKVTSRRAWCVSQGGSAFLYWLDPTIPADQRSRVAEALRTTSGVTGVLAPEEFGRLGVPTDRANPETPDLVLTTGRGFSFSDELKSPVVADAGGPKGTHGHDPRPDYMHATFLAAGQGVKAGVKLNEVRNVDVAPTIARLLNLEMKEPDGRVLREILAAPAP